MHHHHWLLMPALLATAILLGACNSGPAGQPPAAIRGAVNDSVFESKGLGVRLPLPSRWKTYQGNAIREFISHPRSFLSRDYHQLSPANKNLFGSRVLLMTANFEPTQRPDPKWGTGSAARTVWIAERELMMIVALPRKQAGSVEKYARSLNPLASEREGGKTYRVRKTKLGGREYFHGTLSESANVSSESFNFSQHYFVTGHKDYVLAFIMIGPYVQNILESAEFF